MPCTITVEERRRNRAAAGNARGQKEARMTSTTLAKTFAVSCAIAMAAACNNNGSANADRDGAATRAEQQPADTARDNTADNVRAGADDRDATVRQTPIAITGCLQKGDGHTYILTRANEPSQKSVGTSGQEGAVQREQMRSAANSYRIDPSGDVKIDDMVGKQVKVNGTLAEPADLPKDKDANDVKIKEGDIAKIETTTVSIVSANCR
jgi:hypothetical protein